MVSAIKDHTGTTKVAIGDTFFYIFACIHSYTTPLTEQVTAVTLHG